MGYAKQVSYSYNGNKGIQEQQKMIQELQNEIKNLKEGEHNDKN